MKQFVIFAALLLATPAFAQSTIGLDSCYSWTRANYPNLKQSGIWTQISALKQENIKTSQLPQLTLNGQASYQSDVTKLDIEDLPISISPVSKDQYKAYAEFRQSIWDGGVTNASAEVEKAVLQNNLSQLEVELYQLNEQVSQAFFTALAIHKQDLVLQAQIKVLRQKQKEIRSAIKNQAMEQSADWEIEAEILSMEQNRIELQATKSAAIHILSILTGKEIDASADLLYTAKSISATREIYRPENTLFSLQRQQLETQSKLLGKTRNPKIFGYGQAGYGRPGLNMLNDDFDTYYLVGLGMSWNAFDWKNTSRQQQILKLQSEMLNRQEETFEQTIEMLLARQAEQIYKLEELLKTDTKMVTLRSNIAKASASKLQNETITTSDYLSDVQAETIAKRNAELHQIQLNEAQEKYRLIQGKQ